MQGKSVEKCGILASNGVFEGRKKCQGGVRNGKFKINWRQKQPNRRHEKRTGVKNTKIDTITANYV